MAFDEDFIKKPIGIPQIKIPRLPVINSIPEEMERKMRELDKEMEPVREEIARRNEAILRAADAAEAQTELLENQLREVMEQNELLQENNRTLKELYEKVKEEAVENKTAANEARRDSKKNARRARTANWFAGLSLLVSVASIVYTVLSSLGIIPWW